MEIFMYKPNKLADFPRNHVKEWYFESSNQCVVPGKAQKDIITSKTNGNGSVFILSFHCEQKDELRCYLYTKGQLARFLAPDIYQLLPKLFIVEDGSENEKFIKREKETQTKTKKIILVDRLFDDFRRQTSKKR
eukprot:UN12272